MTSKYRESDKRADGSYAFESLSLMSYSVWGAVLDKREREGESDSARERPKLIFKGKYSNTTFKDTNK